MELSAYRVVRLDRIGLFQSRNNTMHSPGDCGEHWYINEKGGFISTYNFSDWRPGPDFFPKQPAISKLDICELEMARINAKYTVATIYIQDNMQLPKVA